MTEAPTRSGIVWRDALLALLVLALAFLNFGHTNIAFASGGRLVVTTQSWCGNPLLPVQGDHTPCHACRIGQAACLPPAPAGVEPVRFVAVPFTHAAPVLPANSVPLLLAAHPRGPPAA